MEVKFNLLQDEPVDQNNDEYHKFYHEYFIPALKEILSHESCVHTIGLFGSRWSGKSTIIDCLRSSYGTDFKSHIFVFDVRKYQDDSLRRSFIQEFWKFLKEKKIIKNGKIEYIEKKINRLYKSLQEIINRTSTESEDGLTRRTFFLKKFKKIKDSALENQIKIWYFLIFLSILFLGYYFLYKYIPFYKEIFWIWVFSYLAFTILWPAITDFFKKYISTIINVTAPALESRETQEFQERINSPEEFEDIFKEMIESIKEKEEVIIVFDNVDRVQGDTAISILSTIKTFLSPKWTAKKIVFLVPCDNSAINDQIKKNYSKDNWEYFDPSEFLRKIFNLIIYTPSFIDSDLELYTDRLIEKTWEIWDKYLNNDDIKFVIRSAFNANPREIKQFINNLIWVILVVLKSNVANVILHKEKIGYLAKVLVLQSKFPDAYRKLKDRWYDPESITWELEPFIEPQKWEKEITVTEKEKETEKEKQKQSLNDFMEATSLITVDDAEPFIYFKVPIIEGKLSDAIKTKESLTKKDDLTFKSLAENEIKNGNIESLIKFIVSLFKSYRSQVNILRNIFETQLNVFNDLNLDTDNHKNYINECATLLHKDLWQNNQELSPDMIFNYFISKKNLNLESSKRIINRYIYSLNIWGRKKSFVFEVLKNLVKYKEKLDPAQNKKIATIIQEYFIKDIKNDEFFKKDIEILKLFEAYTIQKEYITLESFKQFISFVTGENFGLYVPIINTYKDFIIAYGLYNDISSKITEILQLENNKPEILTSDNLFQSINSTIDLFADNFSSIENEIINQQTAVLIQTFRRINYQDIPPNLIALLRRYEKHPNIWANNNELHILISQFLQSVDKKNVVDIVRSEAEKSDSQLLLKDYFDIFISRIHEDEILEIMYTLADKETKNRVLESAIAQRSDYWLVFINKMRKDFKREDQEKVLWRYLSKVTSLSEEEKGKIYEYVKENINEKSSAENKNIVISQIKNLLTNEGSEKSSALGLTLLQWVKGSLNETQKRDIAQTIILFLKETGRVIEKVKHNNSIGAIAYLFECLSHQQRDSFIYILFELLDDKKTEENIIMALEFIEAIKPAYSDCDSKYYEDLLERLRHWGIERFKIDIIESFIKNKPPKIVDKDEKSFWKELENMKEQEENKLKKSENNVEA